MTDLSHGDLRDQMAMAFMAGATMRGLLKDAVEMKGGDLDAGIADFAQGCYRMADAMLKARDDDHVR